MNKRDTKLKQTDEDRAKLFGILAPYKGFVAMLVLLAMAASSINLVIPKIIASAIDAFTANSFDTRKVVIQFWLQLVQFLL